MGDFTASLSRSEFRCKCCDFDTVDHALVEALQGTVDNFGGYKKVMIIILSGCRCPVHNKAVGGADDSWHPKARAGDFKLKYRDTGKPVPPVLIYKYLIAKYTDKFGVGLYETWVHLDTDSNPRRWQTW